MISSSEASGFPEFMRKVLKNLDFEDLLKIRLISMTFYRVTTKFSYNLNVNLWLIGSCD